MSPVMMWALGDPKSMGWVYAHGAGSAIVPPTSSAGFDLLHCADAGVRVGVAALADRGRKLPPGAMSASRITGSNAAASDGAAFRITTPSGKAGTLTGMISPG